MLLVFFFLQNIVTIIHPFNSGAGWSASGEPALRKTEDHKHICDIFVYFFLSDPSALQLFLEQLRKNSMCLLGAYNNPISNPVFFAVVTVFDVHALNLIQTHQ